jgi:sugar phosphate isomerase/epimerase
VDQTSSKLPYVLTAYGIPHVLGYLNTMDGSPNPAPLSIRGLMETAHELGLEGVEIPVNGRDAAHVSAIAQDLAELDLKIVPDHVSLLDEDTDGFCAFLRAAHQLGSKVARVTISRILCGDRRGLEAGWAAYLDDIARRLRLVLPVAEDLGVAVCLENHQDATSDDLLWLYEASGKSSSFGVTLDAGNPLAVGEGPMEFARRLGALIRHVHVKDYTIHFAPTGYRLVRCVAGEGVVPFPELLAYLRSQQPEILPGIEIAAQATRTVPLLEDTWWHHYPEKHPRYLIEALRVLWSHGRPADEPYGSAWERGESSEAVLAEEWDVMRRSVDYFRSISTNDTRESA